MHAILKPVLLGAMLLGAVLSVVGFSLPARAQHPPVHHLYRSDWPAGTVGQARVGVQRRLAGYFQPVEFRGPKSLRVAVMAEGVFHEPQRAPAKAGLLVGAAYRFRVTGIPNHEGREVYPTVEIIDRLHPPPGLKWKCPIPIEFTQEELQYALDGRMVTRVIYLESPSSALPQRQPKQQRFWEVRPSQDPLHVADQLGRPMAILRMGSRTLDPTGADASFHGGPPVMIAPLDEPTLPRSPYAEQIEPPPAGTPRVHPNYEYENDIGTSPEWFAR